MEVSYNWIIERIKKYQSYDGNNDVVYEIDWRINATGDNISATNYGSCALKLTDLTNFIPYEDLTENIVVEWINDNIGEENIEEIKKNLAGEIFAKKEISTTIDVEFPWNK